jgi:hypothetical protein
MRTLTLMTILAVLILPAGVFAETQTYTATHTYILGDHDSKDDARRRCLLEAKRKILEQAGVYIESVSEVNNLDLTKDKITSFAAAVMQVKDSKEDVGFQQGHMTLTLKLTAQVDLAEVRKQLAARQVDAGVRDDVATQKERLKRLEAQFEAMQRQQQAPGRAPASPPSDISASDLQWLRTQAAQGNAAAQAKLGLLYDTGLGVPKDYAQAAKWYEDAAVQGNVNAQFLLGALYAHGEGVPQDYAKARRWYEKAAAQGDAQAQQNLGALYFNGHGVPQDYGQARHWWEKAAAQGYANSQNNLGELYGKGQGVQQNYAKAQQWCEKAAAQGHAVAQSNLGVLYEDGRGVPQDYVTARQWYEKAAVQGDATAQRHIGRLHAEGLGGAQDYVRAYMWINLAAASTGGQQKLAADNRDELARIMTPAQISQAQRLSQQCQAQQFKGC